MRTWIEGLSEAERAQIHLITFVAHSDPIVHPIYHEPWLRALSDKVLTYNIPKEEFAELHNLEEAKRPGNKSMYVYGYLLDKCLKTNSEWITRRGRRCHCKSRVVWQGNDLVGKRAGPSGRCRLAIPATFLFRDIPWLR